MHVPYIMPDVLVDYPQHGGSGYEVKLSHGSEPTLYGEGPFGGPTVVSTFIDLQNSLVASKAATVTPTPVGETSVVAKASGSLAAPAPACQKLTDKFGSPAYSDLIIQLNN